MFSGNVGMKTVRRNLTDVRDPNLEYLVRFEYPNHLNRFMKVFLLNPEHTFICLYLPNITKALNSVPPYLMDSYQWEYEGGLLIPFRDDVTLLRDAQDMSVDVNDNPNFYHQLMTFVKDHGVPRDLEDICIWEDRWYLLPLSEVDSLFPRSEYIAEFLKQFDVDESYFIWFTQDADWLSGYDRGFFTPVIVVDPLHFQLTNEELAWEIFAYDSQEGQDLYYRNPLDFIDMANEKNVSLLLQVFVECLWICLTLKSDHRRELFLFPITSYFVQGQSSGFLYYPSAKTYIDPRERSDIYWLEKILALFPNWFRMNVLIEWNNHTLIHGHAYEFTHDDDDQLIVHTPPRHQQLSDRTELDEFMIHLDSVKDQLAHIERYQLEKNGMDFSNLDAYSIVDGSNFMFSQEYFLQTSTDLTTTDNAPICRIRTVKKLSGGKYNCGVYVILYQELHQPGQIHQYCMKITKKIDKVNVVNIALSNKFRMDDQAPELYVIRTRLLFRWGWRLNDIVSICELGEMTLHEALKMERYRNEDEKNRTRLGYAFQMLHGLYSIHRFGYLHRDAHANNFIKMSSGILKINDLGLAVHWKDDPVDWLDRRLWRSEAIKVQDTEEKRKAFFFFRATWEKNTLIKLIQSDILPTGWILDMSHLVHLFPFWGANVTDFPNPTECYLPIPYDDRLFTQIAKAVPTLLIQHSTMPLSFDMLASTPDFLHCDLFGSDTLHSVMSVDREPVPVSPISDNGMNQSYYYDPALEDGNARPPFEGFEILGGGSGYVS